MKTLFLLWSQNFRVCFSASIGTDFSISGKQKGFDDVRGTLFFNVLEILKQKQPAVLFLENVKHF